MAALLFSFFLFCLMNAQQDVQFTHFKDYAQYYNPAYTGTASNICADLLYRNQWTGLAGSPKSTFFDVRYANRNLHGAIGLTILKDVLGFQNNSEVNLAYAYTRKVKGGKLNGGVTIGLKRASWGTGFVPPETLADNSIPVSGIASGAFNSNAGIYYSNSNLYLGLSATNLTQSFFKVKNSLFNYQNVRHYYVLAGYKHRISSIWLLEPSVFAKSDISSTQIDLSIKTYYNQRIYGALNYRFADAVCPQFGVLFYIPKGVMTGSVSYDLTTSQIRQYSSGSTEVRLSFCYKLQQIFPDRYVDPRDLGKL